MRAMPKQPVNLRLDPALLAAADEFARTTQISRTELVERSLRRELAHAGLVTAVTRPHGAPDLPAAQAPRDRTDAFRQATARKPTRPHEFVPDHRKG